MISIRIIIIIIIIIFIQHHVHHNHRIHHNRHTHHLRELFYDRNPGDARVKVGSDRQAASSPSSANAGVDEIGYFSRAALSAGTLENWPFHREDYSKKAPRWAKRALIASLLGGTLASRNYAYNLMPSCSRQLRTDPWFSSGQFSSLGTQSRPETVPRLPDTLGCPGAFRYY